MMFTRAAQEAPATAGAYVLLARLERPLAICAGGVEATLAPGLYLYCGSARGPGGIRARLARHMRPEKKIHWHIDQLTRAARIEGAFVAPGGDECALNAALSHLPAPVRGFGASDCPRCISHLRRLPSGAALPSAMEHARKGANSRPNQCQTTQSRK